MSILKKYKKETVLSFSLKKYIFLDTNSLYFYLLKLLDKSFVKINIFSYFGTKNTYS